MQLSVESSEFDTMESFDTPLCNSIQFVDDNRRHVVFRHRGRDYSFELVFEHSNPESNWLTIEDIQSNTQRVTLNVAHPFFHPYTADSRFLEIVERFAFALTLAEIDSRSSSVDGRIDPSCIRKRMNESLKAVMEARGPDG